MAEKGIDIKGTNITAEEMDNYTRVAKKGVNYNDLPEVIEPDLQENQTQKEEKQETRDQGTQKEEMQEVVEIFGLQPFWEDYMFDDDEFQVDLI